MFCLYLCILHLQRISSELPSISPVLSLLYRTRVSTDNGSGVIYIDKYLGGKKTFLHITKQSFYQGHVLICPEGIERAEGGSSKPKLSLQA